MPTRRSSTMPSRPICCTCRFWEGTRTLGAFNVEHDDASGRCGNPYSPTFRGRKDPRASCPAWEGVR
jgi:hypothetical protein